MKHHILLDLLNLVKKKRITILNIIKANTPLSTHCIRFVFANRISTSDFAMWIKTVWILIIWLHQSPERIVDYVQIARFTFFRLWLYFSLTIVSLRIDFLHVLNLVR